MPYSSRTFDALIQHYAKVYGIRPSLLHAVIKKESDYDPEAKSSKGARGLMQVLPSTAKELG